MHRQRWIWFVALIVASCQQKDPGKLQVSGVVKNLADARKQFPDMFPSDSVQLFLYEVPFGADASPVKLDSTSVTSSKTNFRLSGQVKGEGLYDVMIGNGPMIPLVNDENDIRLDINLADHDKYYSVAGSKASDDLRAFIFGYSEKSARANSAFKRLDSLKMYNAADSLLLAATDNKNTSLKAVNDVVEQALAQTDNANVATFILGTGSNTLPADQYETALNKAIAKHPSASGLNYLKNQLVERKKQVEQTEQMSSWVGKPAPDLTMPGVDDHPVSLSSFRGKYVLVDFWASWCGPCRMENPNVVKAYNNFKNKNFTVLGVSLDKDKSAWLQAIHNDHLDWTHMSDLSYWDSKAVQTYKFQGIPYNVLIDPNGTVIGESLRGDDLDKKLAQVLK